MQRGHVVALGDIIRIAGDKYDLHRLVFAADRPRHAHPVHARHFDIQQQHVVILVFLIMEQKSLRGFKALRLHGQAALRRPLIQQCAHIGGVRRAVIADGNAYRHTFLLPFIA